MKYTSGRYTSRQLMDNIFDVEDWITREALAGTNMVISDEKKQRDMSNRIIDLSLGLNECIFDDNGRPSLYTVYRPTEKARLDYLSNSGAHFTHTGNELHPSFITNGNLVEYLIGKYLAGKGGSSNDPGYAVSLRGLDPVNTISFDNSLARCTAKGSGHHLMTQAEWAYLSLLAIREGFQPRGNDNYGKSYQDATEKGVASYVYSTNGAVIARTKTGSGALSWHLDGTPFSPADLRGNVREWNGGYRINDGELQILVNNNAADNTKDQSAISTEWKAIMPDGSIVAPGTAGTLKWDYVSVPAPSGTAGFRLNTAIENVAPDTSAYGVNSFASLAAKEGVTVPNLLIYLGLMPTRANAVLGTQYMRNIGERLGLAGGHWSYTSHAGLGYRLASGERAGAGYYLGFRPAFYRALTA